jgi:pimeloyl-ACP methyl ester carboxylesterase
MPSVPRRLRARAESRYRVHRTRGAAYFTSRQPYGDLSIVVKRFPRRDDGDGPVFVLVHGIGVSSRYFQPTAAELARLGRVYLVDLPGYGAAPDPKRDVSLDDHADVLAGFLEASALGAPIVVGHSMGAQVVARLALRHPGLVSSIVLMAPTLPPEARTFWRAIGRLLHDGLREPLIVTLIAATDYFIRCGVPYLLRQMPHLLNDRLEHVVSSLTVPTLVLAGDRDPIVPPAWGEDLARRVPGAQYATVAGAHVVMFTDPQGIADEIARFAR